jgi:hypothetical protein
VLYRPLTSNNILKEIGSNPISGLDGPLGFQEVEAPRIPRRSAYEGGKVVGPTLQLPLPPRRQEVAVIVILPLLQETLFSKLLYSSGSKDRTQRNL